ncbi:site-specific integrase [Devosia sp. 1635]|uniref:tyrosine-type recombinase/integrase n=1 Tax=Devosia sp. 1635 TaxID=2726066 RepID=UPI0015649FA3
MWGGSIPTDSASLARHLADLSTTHAVASISRRIAAIAKAHAVAGHDNPCGSELVSATMRGIRRRLGTAQQQARPLLRDDLFAILDRLGNRPKDMRDRAMLLIGFATAMRRSELVALNVEDVETTSRGLMVTVRRSKTDQEGRGRQIAVPPGRTRHCPVAAFKEWVAFAQLENGPIFRGVDRHGKIHLRGVSGEAVSHVIKARLSDAGYDPAGFSGHSLRAGFVTAAALAGAPSHKIRETTGHRSDASMTRYLRHVDLFHDPAIARVL